MPSLCPVWSFDSPYAVSHKAKLQQSHRCQYRFLSHRHDPAQVLLRFLQRLLLLLARFFEFREFGLQFRIGGFALDGVAKRIQLGITLATESAGTSRASRATPARSIESFRSTGTAGTRRAAFRWRETAGRTALSRLSVKAASTRRRSHHWTAATAAQRHSRLDDRGDTVRNRLPFSVILDFHLLAQAIHQHFMHLFRIGPALLKTASALGRRILRGNHCRGQTQSRGGQKCSNLCFHSLG